MMIPTTLRSPSTVRVARNHRRALRRVHARPGFTLVEMLVVIGIIVLIIGLVAAVLGPMRVSSQRTKCLSNQRQIALACNAYATDNASRWVSPRTDKMSPEAGAQKITNPWVNAHPTEGTLTPQGIELKGSLEKGVLWTYMDQNYEAYRSPQDGSNRVRSYSLNAFVGVGGAGTKKADDLYVFGKKTIVMSAVKQPARTLCTICEGWGDDYYNGEGWVIHPTLPQWIDLPAVWDGTRLNISLCDGSVESLQILWPKLVTNMYNYGNWYTEPSPSPSWSVMRQYLLPGDV
jgi:prepilin-type N-terminal cleavage/methylation domain-containing protein